MEDKELPKPTLADYEKRAGFNILFAKGMVNDELNSEYLDLMNSFDWSAELIYEGAKVGLKTALGESKILLPIGICK